MPGFSKKGLIFFLSCLLMVFGFPGQSVGVYALTDSILETTGLSRNFFSLIYTCATVTGCFLMMVLASTIDRFGMRRTVLSVLMIWSGLFFVLGQSNFLYERYIGDFFNKTSFFAVLLYLTFSLLRFLGQNMLPMLGRTQISRTFYGRQGLAIAFGGALVAIASGAAPRIMHFLSGNDGWQQAYNTLVFVGFFIFLTFVLLFRDLSFEDQQLPALSKSFNSPENFSGKVSRLQLLKMPIFWCVMLPLCLNAFVGSGITIHLLDIFRENNLGERRAIDSQFYMCCVSVLSGFLFGRAIDRGKVKLCLLFMLIFQSLGIFGLECFNGIFGFWVYVVCLGCSWGGYGVIIALAWVKIFGSKYLGSILGMTYFSTSFIGAISVSIMSFAKEFSGSYFPIIRITECVIVVAFVFVLANFPRNLSDIREKHIHASLG